MKSNSRITTKAVIATGMFAAILSVLSIIQIPMPTGVPITLQTFAVAFCGYVLGWRRGGAAALIYLVIGAVGVPVYAGMTSGPGMLFGATGGFIFGFVPMAALCGLGMGKGFRGKPLVLGISGLFLCHLLGALQFGLVTGNGILESLLIASVPYLIKDVLSVAGAWIAAAAVRRALRASSLLEYGKAA